MKKKLLPLPFRNPKSCSVQVLGMLPKSPARLWPEGIDLLKDLLVRDAPIEVDVVVAVVLVVVADVAAANLGSWRILQKIYL